MRLHVVCLLITLAAFCAGLAAQPMVGTFTCANGNPGAAFDYGDIGDFFDDIESRGLGGHVVLDIFDDGGPFTSSPSYALGIDTTAWTFVGVAGLSANSTLTIRAAAGERPVITGSGASWAPNPHLVNPPPSATLLVFFAPHTTIEGLELVGGSQAGILFSTGNGYFHNNYTRISRCRIHGVTAGSAIRFDCPQSSNVVIDTNFVWNCQGYSWHGLFLDCDRPGIEWEIYNNTVMLRPNLTSLGWPVFRTNSSHPSPVFLAEVSNNVVFLDCSAYIGAAYLVPPTYWDGNHFGPNGAGYPANADHGIVHIIGPHRIGTDVSLRTWAQWQTAGFDQNSLTVDPRLVNTTPGFEDLHLLPDSPAIDRGVAGPNAGLDVDGDQRPSGSGIDWGADEFMQPEIAVESNAMMLTHLGMVDVGLVPANGGTRQFVIHNVERGSLYLGSPPLTLTPGANCAAGTSVLTLPPGTVAPNSSEPFTIRIVPAAAGAFDLTIEIDSSDRATPRFTFTVTGTGVPANQAAVADVSAGSGFSGPTGGPFTASIDPGATLVNLALELTDVEADAITVTAVQAMGTVPLGIAPPAIPQPGHPLVLTWTGVADAANAPGPYTWRISFHDAGNGSPMQVLVTLTMNDLPPSHAASPGVAGSGTSGAPYHGNFRVGDDVASVLAIAQVTDPNSAQALNMGVPVVLPGYPGTVGFVFSLHGGALQVSPSGVLTQAEVGTRNYRVSVSDGTNAIELHVEIVVSLPALVFTNPATLPTGTVGVAYSVQLQVVNAQGAVTFALSSGALPAGLTLDTATGQITGEPLLTEVAVFTIQAVDSTTALGTETFTLSVDTTPSPSPAGGGSSGGAGCAAGLTVCPWLVGLLLVCVRRRRARD